MTTILTILLWVAIALNVWLMISAAKRERERRKLLQERMDEFDDATKLHESELKGARRRLTEAMTEVTKLKKLHDKMVAEHEDLKLSYQRTVKERDDVKEKYSALLVKRADLLAEIERLKEDPVDGGEPAVHDQPGEPAGKPLGEAKPMTLVAAENGYDFSAWNETTATIELNVKPKHTKRGKIMRDWTLERFLRPKRCRLPRKMKKRLKRENNGNLPFVINCEVIGRDNDTLIVQANGLQYGTRQKL